VRIEFRLAPHSQLAGAQVVELWRGGEFLGQVTADDDRGVRVISKHALALYGVILSGVHVVTITIGEP